MEYKAYSDSYLISLTKAEIIELLRIAEHNFFATEEALNNSVKAGMEIAGKYDRANLFVALRNTLVYMSPNSECRSEKHIFNYEY